MSTYEDVSCISALESCISPLHPRDKYKFSLLGFCFRSLIPMLAIGFYISFSYSSTLDQASLPEILLNNIFNTAAIMFKFPRKCLLVLKSTYCCPWATLAQGFLLFLASGNTEANKSKNRESCVTPWRTSYNTAWPYVSSSQPSLPLQ